MRLFLSYGHDEHAGLVRRVKADLEGEGFEVWLDEQAIRSSQDWEHSIEKGLAGADAVVAFLTPHAMRRPDGVCLDELAYARFQGKPITPVMVQFVQPPLSISRIQWLDMRNWCDLATGEINEAWYRERFGQLLAAIRGEHKLGFEGEQSRLRAILKPLEYGAEIDRHVRGFCGRGWVFEAFDAWLARERDSRAFWITGPAGVGKSALSAMLAHRRPAVAGVHFCRHGDSDRADPRKAILSLAYQLATQLPDYQHALLALPELDELAGKNAAALFSTLLVEPLRGLGPQTDRRVLVIDALDEAEHDGKNDLVGLIGREAKQLPEWLGLMITSRPEPEILRKLSSLKPYRLEASDANNQADLRAYLTRELGAKLIGPVGERALGVLLERSEGNFLYATQVLEAIRAGTLELAQPEALPTGLTGVYQHLFERQFGDEGAYKKRVRPLLEVVLAAREPLPVELAAEALGWDEYERDEVVTALGSLFPVHEGAIAPFHKSVADWLEDREKSGPYRASAAKGHERLAQTLWAAYARDPESLSPYGLRHLPGHLAAVGRIDDLATALLALDFGMAKIRLGLVEELVSDYELASERCPHHCETLELWMRFLRGNAHVLRRGTTDWPANRILLQLAWEHADDSPVSRAAERWLEQQRCDWTWLRRRSRPRSLRAAPIARLEGTAGGSSKAWRLPGSRFLNASSGEIRVWSAKDGRLLAAWRVSDTASARAVLDTGAVIIESRTLEEPERALLQVCDPMTGEPSAELRVPHPLAGPMLADCGQGFVVLAPDSGQLVGEGRVVGWDTHAGIVRWQTEAHPDDCGGLLRLRSGLLLTWMGLSLKVKLDTKDSPPELAEIRVWSPDSGELVGRLRGHTGAVIDVLELPSGHIVSVSYDRAARVWDVTTGECLRVFPTAPSPRLHRLGGDRFALAGRRDLSIDNKGERHAIRVMSASRDHPLATFEHVGEEPRSVVELADSRVLSLGVANACVWNPHRAEEAAVVMEGVSPHVLSDGQVLIRDPALGHPTGRAVLFGICGREGDGRLGLEDSALDALLGAQQILLQGETLLIDGELWPYSSFPRVPLSRVASRRSLARASAALEELRREFDALEDIELADGSIALWRRELGVSLLDSSPEPRDERSTAIFIVTPDPERIAHVLVGHEQPIFHVEELSNGTICSCADDGVRIWDRRQGRLVATLPGDVVPGAVELAIGVLVTATTEGLSAFTLAGRPIAQLQIPRANNHSGYRFDRMIALGDSSVLAVAGACLWLWDPAADALRWSAQLPGWVTKIEWVTASRWMVVEGVAGDSSTSQCWLVHSDTGRVLAAGSGERPLVGAKTAVDGRVFAWCADGSIGVVSPGDSDVQLLCAGAGRGVRDVWGLSDGALLVYEDPVGWVRIDRSGARTPPVGWVELIRTRPDWLKAMLEQERLGHLYVRGSRIVCVDRGPGGAIRSLEVGADLADMLDPDGAPSVDISDWSRFEALKRRPGSELRRLFLASFDPQARAYAQWHSPASFEFLGFDDSDCLSVRDGAGDSALEVVRARLGDTRQAPKQEGG